MSFEVPESVKPIRAAVLRFIEERVYPVETLLEERDTAESARIMRELMQAARKRGSGRWDIPRRSAARACRSWTTCT